MRFAFVLFDEMTALDFVGVFDPISRVRTMGFSDTVEWELVARSAPLTATVGLTFQPSAVASPLDRYDVVIVPGGAGARPGGTAGIDVQAADMLTRFLIGAC